MSVNFVTEFANLLRSPTSWEVYNGLSLHMCVTCNTYYAATDASVINSSANVLYLNFALLPQGVESRGLAKCRDVEHLLCMCLLHIIWGINYIKSRHI